MVRHPAGKGAIHRPKRRSFFAALQEERPIGFCCLMSTGRDTAEPAVMGVRREYRRGRSGQRTRGSGRLLLFAGQDGADGPVPGV